MTCADCGTSLILTPCTSCGVRDVPAEADRAAVCAVCWYGLPFEDAQQAVLRARDARCRNCAAQSAESLRLDAAGAAQWGAQLGSTWAQVPAPIEIISGQSVTANNGRRLLIVDDDEDILASATDILENHGYVVSLALDGKQAMSWLQSPGDLPDAILMDLHMPGMDGEKFSMARRAMPHAADIPLIIWSAHTLSEDKIQSLAVHAFLKKPCEANTLVQAVDNAVGV